ncbi:glycosyltransferase [Arcticibacter sp.]|uniref:glycosyltransferase n=1 Tax=Arcticibacter sp. TaxID=1872630 RepID=UPI0038901C3E
MSKNKITRKIDEWNQIVCYKLASSYYRNSSSGQPSYYILHPKNWLYLILRAFILCIQYFRLNKKLLTPYWFVLKEEKHWQAKLKGLLLSLLGTRHFFKPEYSPLFYTANQINFQFNASTKPIVSIIIQVAGDHSFLFDTLRALCQNLPDDVSTEIIVVDSSDTDVPADDITNIPGITYVKLQEYFDERTAYLSGIEKANGTYSVFLTSGTLIQKGWLEALLNTMINDPSIDVVGSKLIHPSGLLMEAGGILLENGTTQRYGQFKNPDKHLYNFNRETDFCTLSLFRTENARSAQNKIIYVAIAVAVVFDQPAKAAPGIHLLMSPETLVTNCRSGKTILVIEATLPYYDKDSGSNRILHLLKIFKSLDYHVVFLPDNGEATEPYSTMLKNLGIEVIYKYMGVRVWNKELRSCLQRVNIVWLSRPDLNEKYNYLFELNKSLKWIYDTVDLHYIRLEREALLINDEVKKANLQKRASAYKEMEISLSKRADVTIAITEAEAAGLVANGSGNVKVVPNIHVAQKGTTTDFLSRQGIMFIGGFYHQPNVDAVIYLINEIMPLVWKTLSDVQVHLVGSNPPAEVLNLANERVIVTGYVQDVGPYFNSSRVFVAPLRYGAGMKGKIGQALEYALPAVSTGIGTEGMNLRNGINVIEANTVEEFQQGILELYTNQQLWEKLHNNALEALAPLLFDHQKENIKNILSSLDQSYKVTIITVVKNGEATLQALIDSIQKYKTPEMEFIVWDGQSTDRTLDILKQNSDTVDQYVSLPDSSIYDAMNKAVKLAKGKFIHFMGSDDILLEGFQKIVPYLQDEKTIYYGGVLTETGTISRPFDAYQLTKQHICHQAIIYPKAVFEKYTFDTSYNVFADYHLNLRCWTDTSFKKEHVNLIIAKFSPGGYSDLTQDVNATRHKEKWFKELLSTRDHLRYLKHKSGYLAAIGEYLSGQNSHILPAKPISKHSILMIGNRVRGERQTNDQTRTSVLIRNLLNLSFEILFLNAEYYCEKTELETLSAEGVKFIDTTASPEDVWKTQLDMVEFVWFLGTPDNRLLKRIVRKRHIKRIFDISDLQNFDRRSIELAKTSDSTITRTEEARLFLKSNDVNNVYLPVTGELQTLFNNLR